MDYRAAKTEQERNSNGLAKLTARTWGASSGCLAGALLVHGLGAHSGWFEALGRRLKVRQIYCIAYDQVGFGQRSSQTFTSYQQWLEDFETAYNHTRARIGKSHYSCWRIVWELPWPCERSALDISATGLAMFSPGFDGSFETFTLMYRIKAIWQALLQPETEIDLPYALDWLHETKSLENG